MSNENSQIIDPNNPQQVGMLIGMMGGTVTDAVVVQFALRRFEQSYGRKPTVADVGIIAGMIAASK